MNVDFYFNIDIEKFFADGKELLEKHWDELANYKDVIELNPDIEKYKKLQELGYVKTVSAYVDGEMVGYSGVILSPLLHYKSDIDAFVDVIYVNPDFRNTTIGIQLINKTEELAKECGASVITHHVKPDHPTLAVLLKRKKYKLAEYKYSKLLKGT